ncbi:DUF2158 domain-containing protein [Erythrobacter sp. AP23]|uniref:DUF2158 domain-containing protein n=1 Tax=Erythrobacter sp. AP23 TaxID=499656 RepID=UPI00076D6408|nr:hypothetical protein ASS64_06655 [Erythrobacter sp. AP23]
MRKGDVVMLRSGGPKMTVEKIHWTVVSEISRVRCVHIRGDGQMIRQEFDPELLMVAPHD